MLGHQNLDQSADKVFLAGCNTNQLSSKLRTIDNRRDGRQLKMPTDWLCNHEELGGAGRVSNPTHSSGYPRLQRIQFGPVTRYSAFD